MDNFDYKKYLSEGRIHEVRPGELQDDPFNEPEGKDPHHEELVALVRELDPNEYEVFAFDAEVDAEDANEMMNWIYSLTDSEVKDEISKLKGINEDKLIAIKEDNFDARLKAKLDISDEEFDDITSRDIGEPFPGTDDDDVSNGYKAAQALKDELRNITYKKLSDEELDTFSKEMILHFLDNTTAQATAKIFFGKRGL
jgi:hypothetical protein